MSIETSAMKDEYDFSRGRRGKYFYEGAAVVPPVRLDSDVLSYLSALAAAARSHLTRSSIVC
jgi:hypothetical protein